MRALPLLLAATLLTVVAIAPTATAFTYCTSTGLTQYRCSEHFVCIGGGSYGRWNEHCQIGVPNRSDPCALLTCGPWPPLP